MVMVNNVYITHSDLYTKNACHLDELGAQISIFTTWEI